MRLARGGFCNGIEIVRGGCFTSRAVLSSLLFNKKKVTFHEFFDILYNSKKNCNTVSYRVLMDIFFLQKKVVQCVYNAQLAVQCSFRGGVQCLGNYISCA